LKRGPIVSRKHILTDPNFLTITVISYLFLYMLTTYYWKGFEESYNFVLENISIRTHMKKLCSHKVWNTFAPWRNMVAPQRNCSPRHMVGPRGEMGISCPNEQMCSFQLQSCDYLWDLSIDRSQAYMKYEIIMIAKSFGTYVSLGNLCISIGKMHCPQGNCFFS
jgi:hypothetical protein